MRYPYLAAVVLQLSPSILLVCLLVFCLFVCIVCLFVCLSLGGRGSTVLFLMPFFLEKGREGEGDCPSRFAVFVTMQFLLMVV